MTEPESPRTLEKKISYTFHDPTILDEALIRRAHLNDKPPADEVSMDPLATLGDAVLDAVSVYRLYEKKIRTKKELTESKIFKVKRKTTRAFAEKNNLGEYIKWGKGEGLDEIGNKGDPSSRHRYRSPDRSGISRCSKTRTETA